MKARHFALLLVGILAAVPTWAGLGEPAPELKIAEWLKGEAVTLADGKGQNVFAVTFYVTTQGPTRSLLQFLSDLQRKYADQGVVFIAISGEKADTVKAYLKANADDWQGRYAVDDSAASFTAYFGSNRAHVPHTFVVDKSGNVVWHAHPMSGLDKILDAVLAGTYDIELGRRVERAQAGSSLYLQMVRSPTKAKNAAPIGEKVLEFGRNDIMLMNDFAWTIATMPGLIKRDYDIALRAAQLAYEGSGGKNAEILDTYARVLFDTGKTREAVKYQEQAIPLAPSAERRAELEQTLEKYRKAAEGG